MRTRSEIASLAALFLLLGSVAAAQEFAMFMAKQDTAPVHLTQIRLVRSNILSGAQLKNESNKRMISYRVGWGSVSPTDIVLHQGDAVDAAAGVMPGASRRVPDEAIPEDQRTRKVIFFVAEAKFADGSEWTADVKDIAKDAGLDFSISLTNRNSANWKTQEKAACVRGLTHAPSLSVVD